MTYVHTYIPHLKAETAHFKLFETTLYLLYLLFFWTVKQILIPL